MNHLVLQLKGLAGLVLERRCPLCDRSTGQAFCQDCQRRVQRCQMAKENQFQVGQLNVFAWGNYGGALKRAIAVLKYENHPQLARPLAHWLAAAWLTHCPPPQSLLVVPIPMHPSKQKQRGFNQADLLAKSFCEFTRLPLVQGLERSQETTAQFALSASEREQNLAQAFTLGKAFRTQRPAAPVLLLDDIYTTGATARSAAQTLRQQGIRVHGIAVVARPLKET